MIVILAIVMVMGSVTAVVCFRKKADQVKELQMTQAVAKSGFESLATPSEETNTIM